MNCKHGPFTSWKDVTSEVTILHINGSNPVSKADLVIKEENLRIFLNGLFLLSSACLPVDLKELGVGYLVSEGFLESNHSIKEIIFERDKLTLDIKIDPEPDISRLKRQKTSSSGISLGKRELGKLSGSKLPHPDKIKKIMREFISSSELFKATGGVHLAALVKDGMILFKSEDIGRHNAVDKVIGKGFLKSTDLSQTCLFLSGRISSEIVKKSIRAGIPAVISKSAPTSAALELGKKYRVSLVGFVRAGRLNVYNEI